MDLPPPTDLPPEQVVVETMNPKIDFYARSIKHSCEASVKAGLKDNYCQPIARAMFVDICNTRDYQKFFQYKVMNNLLRTCNDCCGPRGQDQYLWYHVNDNEIFGLSQTIHEGKDCEAVPTPKELESYPLYIRSLYVLLSNHPELIQSFTTFMCGKDLDKTQPVDKFIKDWYQSTYDFIETIPELP